jgi:tetrahydromethanopterin S-methyltransferase subunit E
LILLQYNAFQVLLLPCWRSFLPPFCRIWTGREAGGSRFTQNVSNYILVTQQHHIVGDWNLGPIFCWISPTYLVPVMWFFPYKTDQLSSLAAFAVGLLGCCMGSRICIGLYPVLLS